MKLRLILLAVTVSAQSQQGNTAVCHTPSATEESTRPAQLMEGYAKCICR